MQQLEIKPISKAARPIGLATHFPAPERSTPPPEEPSLAVEYFRMMIRRRWLVIWTAFCGAAVGIGLTLPQQPLFRAQTSVDVQGVNENFMNMGAVNPTSRPIAETAEAFLQTEIKLLQSDSMTARVSRVVKAQLSATPEPVQDLATIWRRRMGFHVGEPATTDDMIAGAARSVKVKPMGMTRLVALTCESGSPSLAALYCNTLVSEFIKNDREVRIDAAQKTGEYLTQQLQDVRKNLETKERLLQSYAQETTLLSSGDKEGVAQDKLRQLQTELSLAQGERIVKQSQYELTASAAPDSLPPVLDSGPLREYQTKLADLKQQYADYSTAFTADYPKVQRLAAQIKEIEATVSKERGNTISRIKNDYEAARHRETLLTAAYSNQAKLVSALAPKQAQYSMLQHEVESGRQLYETMLQRVKEAGFASAMRSSPLRVVDEASAPLLPVTPRRGLSAAAGLFLGCVGGMFLAFFSDRTDRRLQKPGEATSQLRVRELGVIPAASVDRLPASKAKHLGVSAGSGPKLLGPAQTSTNTLTNSGLELVTWFNRGSLMAESYRGVMSSLLFAGINPAEKMKLVVTSPSVSEGKTTLLSNLGIALAQTKRTVVLVDGDMRRPRLHKIFNVDNGSGLGEVLLGDIDPVTCPLDRIVRSTTVPGLYVVPAGAPVDDAASTLFSPHLAPLLERLSREFSAVLVDSPPMLHLTDARVLARYADGVILVTRAGATTMDAAMNAQQIFEADGTPLVGTVLNDFDPTHELNLNYYKSYHQYQEQKSA